MSTVKRAVAPSWADLQKTNTSMLAPGMIPAGYGRIETSRDALDAINVPPPEITLRLIIVWDNPANNLDLERVLDDMRETGAAMVVSVERVSK